MNASAITPAVTAIVQSARIWPSRTGQIPINGEAEGPSYCRFPISTSSSPSPNNSTRWPCRTRIARDPKHLGAEIGFFSILHTWGQTLTHHPHIHSVVTGGGLRPDRAGWVHGRQRFFLSVRVLSRLFRRLFLEALQKAFEKKRLSFHGNLTPLAEPNAFRALLAPLRHREWVVYAKPPFGGPQQVIDYLGRYTHRVAISNQRLKNVENVEVTFHYKQYRAEDGQQAREMTVSAEEVIRRFLLHTQPTQGGQSGTVPAIAEYAAGPPDTRGGAKQAGPGSSADAGVALSAMSYRHTRADPVSPVGHRPAAAADGYVLMSFRAGPIRPGVIANRSERQGCVRNWKTGLLGTQFPWFFDDNPLPASLSKRCRGQAPPVYPFSGCLRRTLSQIESP